MKLIDYGICFGSIIICFVCVWCHNTKLLTAHGLNTTKVNETMDEIVGDALEKTIMEMYEKYGEADYINNLPAYKNILIENLKKEMEFIMAGTGNDDGKRLMEERIECAFLVWQDKMYVYKNGTFTEEDLTSLNTTDKYVKIISVMENVCGQSLNLPKEDYDKSNKIGDYSFSVVYSAYRGNHKGKPYIIRSFSGAKLRV